MITCDNCQTPAPAGAKFCAECGASLRAESPPDPLTAPLAPEQPAQPAAPAQAQSVPFERPAAPTGPPQPPVKPDGYGLPHHDDSGLTRWGISLAFGVAAYLVVWFVISEIVLEFMDATSSDWGRIIGLAAGVLAFALAAMWQNEAAQKKKQAVARWNDTQRAIDALYDQEVVRYQEELARYRAEQSQQQ